MRVLLTLIPLLLLVTACVPEGETRLHEIVLYGAENTRLTYFYGAPTSLRIGDREITLRRAEGEAASPLAAEGALLVSGEPFLRERIPPLAGAPTDVRHIARSSDMRIRVNTGTGPIVYYDGNMWFTLLGDGSPGVDTRVVPRPRIGGLEGLGELTRAEAHALAAYLEAGGPVALTLLDEIPAAPRPTGGASEYLRTGFYVQRQFASTPAAPRRTGEELVWETLAQGNGAQGVQGQRFELVRDETQLRTLWNIAHGSLLQVPPTPEVNFARETIVALFLGNRPTGGYGIEVERVSVENGELYVDVRIAEPAEGAFTTQAITSPWVMVRILRGGFDSAWIREAGTDRLLGAARPM